MRKVPAPDTRGEVRGEHPSEYSGDCANSIEVFSRKLTVLGVRAQAFDECFEMICDMLTELPLSVDWLSIMR